MTATDGNSDKLTYTITSTDNTFNHDATQIPQTFLQDRPSHRPVDGGR